MNYRLGVDLGTTFTAAAVADGSSEPTVIGLGNRALQIPSVLFLKPEGDFLVGEAAERRGLSDPDRLAREFKRRIGDHVPIMVAGAPFSPQALTAHLLRWVVARAAERMGESPAEVVLTHPANWGPFRLELLDQVVAMAGLTSARRCTEPEAAAIQYSSQTRVTPGDRVAVYDLGGGTFDACVLEKTDTGFRVLGNPEGVEHLGGVDFDEAVLRYVLGALGTGAAALDPDSPEVTVGLARLRRDCVEAKEALSTDVDTLVPVTLPGLSTTVRLTRSEFELMIRPALDETMAAMSRALRSAQVDRATLRSILLVGGSSRIPLVNEMLTREFTVPTALDTHPKHDVALGAVRIGREDTDTLPGVILGVSVPAVPPQTGLAAAAMAVGPQPMASAAIGDPPTEAAGQELERSASERADPDGPPPLKGRPVGLVIAAVVALVVLLATTLALVLRDSGQASGPSTTSPSPTPSQSAVAKSLPGTYTWPSGVKLTLSVKAERFGVRYPYCEDGSCGFADEDDIRVLLTYQVSVPKDLRDPVDLAACPGELVTEPSAPTGSILPVSGSYARPIGTISAGQAKSGVLEYSVDGKLRDADLQVSSTCGDVKKVGEQVLFTGPLPELRAEKTPGDVGDRRTNRDYLKLRVDQVRDDLGPGKYAALVEVCARRTLSAGQKARVRATTSWYLVSNERWRPADETARGVLPRYPYGSLRKGSCASGWVTFDLKQGDPPVRIGFDDNAVRYAWRVAADGNPTATPDPTTTQPPASTPPGATRRARPPDPVPPSSSEPSEEPSPESSVEPSAPSAPPTPRPSSEPSFTS